MSETRALIEKLVDEMEMIARVAGQCSVDSADSTSALMAAAEAERASRWAQSLRDLSVSLSPSSPQAWEPTIELADLEHDDACLLSRLFNAGADLIEINQYRRLNEFLKRTIEAAGAQKDHERTVCPDCGRGFCFDFQAKRVTCGCPLPPSPGAGREPTPPEFRSKVSAEYPNKAVVEASEPSGAKHPSTETVSVAGRSAAPTETTANCDRLQSELALSERRVQALKDGLIETAAEADAAHRELARVASPAPSSSETDLEAAFSTGPLFADAIRAAIAHLEMDVIMRALVIDNASCAVRSAVITKLRAALVPASEREKGSK